MYIEPIFANTIWVSVPFLLSTLFVAHRWRWIWLLLCLLASFGIGFYRQVIIPSDALWLMSHLGIGYSAITLLSWLIYGELLRLQGGVRWPTGKAAQPFKAIFPFLCGALIGELGAAALWAPQVKDPKARARVVLSAMAGGLVSPVGDANILVLAQSIPNMQLYLIPLGLLALLLISQKHRMCPNQVPPRAPHWSACHLIVLYFFVPQNAPLVLLECSLLLAVFTGKHLKNSISQLLWFVVLIAMLTIASAGGLPEFIALGSENIVLNYAHGLPPNAGYRWCTGWGGCGWFCLCALCSRLCRPCPRSFRPTAPFCACRWFCAGWRFPTRGRPML